MGQAGPHQGLSWTREAGTGQRKMLGYDEVALYRVASPWAGADSGGHDG